MIKIIEENDEAHLIHIECQKCGTLVLALIQLDFPQISSQGLVTDLLSSEVKKFKTMAPVNPDDVIDLHYLLKKQEAALINNL